MIIQTFHSLCHIAEVLLYHQQIGNIQYSAWRLKVPCSFDKEIVNKLQELAKEMESKLDNWRECILSARREYYELNYYTTLQLLTIREKLGLFKSCSKDTAVSSDVLALLQCIHPEVDQSIVKKAVCMAISNSQLNDDSSNNHNETGPSTVKEHVDPSIQSHEHHSEVSTINVLQPVKAIMSNLAEDKKAIVAHVTKRVGCSQKLVLMAFESLDNEYDQHHDYVQWCCNHMELDKLSEGSEHSDSGSENLSDDMETLDEDHDDFGFSSGT